MSQDLELCLAQGLGRSWPSVEEIIIRGDNSDDTALLVMRRETGWTLTERKSSLGQIVIIPSDGGYSDEELSSGEELSSDSSVVTTHN